MPLLVALFRLASEFRAPYELTLHFEEKEFPQREDGRLNLRNFREHFHLWLTGRVTRVNEKILVDVSELSFDRNNIIDPPERN